MNEPFDAARQRRGTDVLAVGLARLLVPTPVADWVLSVTWVFRPLVRRFARWALGWLKAWLIVRLVGAVASGDPATGSSGQVSSR